MAPCSLLRVHVLCYFPLLLLVHSRIQQEYNERCPVYSPCGKFDNVSFSLSNSKCGLPIRGCNNAGKNAEVRLGDQTWYEIEKMSQNESLGPSVIIVQDNELQKHLPKICSDFDHDIPPPPSPSLRIFQIANIITMYRCNRTHNLSIPEGFFNYNKCLQYNILYSVPPEGGNFDQNFPASSCSKIQVPLDPEKFPYPGSPNVEDPFIFMTSKLHIKVNLPEKCVECYKTGDICREEVFYCSKAKEKPRIWKVIYIVGSVIVGAFVITIVAWFIYKRRRSSSVLKYQSRNINGDPHSNGDLESSGLFFGIPVFSYKELEEATNNFDHTRELGDGGFGTVYHGKLQDGREVAVKRLYQHNYRRVQQFVTEIEILTRLRHRNLVTLYGCTSRHSRELLLLYEYIPNGTVACHLYGDSAKPGSLPWSVRMKIAVETANALAYLHASDIIHRDVKTNNILLDNSYSVKVADFGLSRLFPNNVTHISTAPQGTPGYLDPEYYQCYQLTSKSDVYSFGVVLIELISSMPAVDITRHRDDINLSSLAIRKIQKSALSELVDPSLGFESDNEVKRMIVSVAELAFQCLQLNKDRRPAMDQVLRMLNRIENETDEPEHLEEEDIHEVRMSNSNVQPPPSPSPEHDEIGSLKNLKTPRIHQSL